MSGEGQGRREPEIWNASSSAIKNAIGPTESWMKAGPHSTRCELMYEGYGQGLASQMTPFQMAMMISVAANLEGRLMKPKIEMERPPEVFNQVLTRDQAVEIRRIMNMVTEGGTANSAMAPVKAAGIRSGGKTGTAQKAVPVIDPKTGDPMKRVVTERDFKGKIIRQYEETVMNEKLRSDAWYLSFAPLEKPAIAMAVLLGRSRTRHQFLWRQECGPGGGSTYLESQGAGLLRSRAASRRHHRPRHHEDGIDRPLGRDRARQRRAYLKCAIVFHHICSCCSRWSALKSPAITPFTAPSMIRGYETSLIGAGPRSAALPPDYRDGPLGFCFQEIQRQLGTLHHRHSALLGRHVGAVSPLQRSGIQRPQQSGRASGKDRHAADALHQSELRRKQANR